MSLKSVAAAFVMATLACGGGGGAAQNSKPTVTPIDLGRAPEASDARLAWAIAGAQRTAQERSRDAYRHPKETLAFFGVTKDSHVVELWPGGGWYTAILAPFLRDSGKLSVTSTDPALEKKLGASPGIYGKVEFRHVAPPGDIALGAEGSADVVLTFRNFHNWVQGGFEKNVVEAAFKVLKQGGVFGVVEHRGDADEDLKTIKESGYVPEHVVVDLAQAAGFKLAGKSEVNANPSDDHTHEGGVWALPPSYANGSKDHDKYSAIGESDRMTLRFEKP
jgi:predicted methyltransferase